MRYRALSMFLLLLFFSSLPIAYAGTDQATPILKIDTEKKVVALTFDDGPDPKYTPILLETLNLEGVKATFFVLGIQAEKAPHILQWIHKAGHEIGNHGYSHPDIKKLKRPEIYQQIKRAEKVILGATGFRPKCYRPPGGVVTPAVLKATFDAGYDLIHWSVDPKDWKRDRTAEVIAGSIENQVGAGDILLFHDGGVNQEESMKALVSLIHDLKQDGYQFVTVSELLEIK
ncbi:polysaccharide deacetylase family protein [Ammoniphilus sp. CFH 90114]|uniref:polysaccharide deacetylase family protein n=1 Tax=Ammoniphilus sp. CFH 90114 TaxID=2493665 RepID=UPI00100DC7BE|nr:polysaccharide deacetylase family protein [Ammoniphilus sp. CFH 90114]RXT05211.1 polysaccharide deacetylase family protein [Ammoniphilus sp. CFH 90114]